MIHRLFTSSFKNLLVFIILLLNHTLIFCVFANEQLFVNQYSNNEGLRQSMVKQVYLDSYGLLWMVTGDGLHLFDGENFKVFRAIKNNQFSQSDNVMRKIIEDVPGKFVVASTSSLLYFDAEKGNFQSIYQKTGLYPELLGEKIDGKPLVWIANKGYFLIDNKTLQPISINFTNNETPAEFIPKQMVWLDSMHFLIQGFNGLIECTKNTYNATTFEAIWIPMPNICCGLSTNSLGKVFMASGSTLFIYQGRGIFEKYLDTNTKDISTIYIDSQDIIWFFETQNKNLYKVINKQVLKYNLLIRDGKHIENINPFIISFFEDKQENLWIGTDGDGVLRYQKKQVIFNKATIGFIRCIKPNNDEIWAGTFKNGLWKLSGNLKNAKRMFPDIFDNSIDIFDIAFDEQGSLWVATPQGIDVINNTGKNVFHYPLTLTLARFYKKNKQILLSTQNSLLYFNSSENHELVKNERQYHISCWVSNNGVNYLGTNIGLSSIESGTVLNTEQFENNLIIPNRQVKDVLIKDSLLWVADNLGISIFSLKGQKDTAYSFLDPLKNELIYALIEDSYGRVWFSSNSGIGCILPDSERIIYFNMDNNLQSLEFNTHAKAVLKKDVFYFGGIKGINQINPNKVNFKNSTSQPVITVLYLADTLYTKGLNVNVNKVSLHWSQSNISGELTSINYFNSNYQQFSFYLNNFDKTWSQPTSSPVFNYRNLPPGNYQLNVKILDSFQYWSNPFQILDIIIKPPIWKTIPFIIGISLLIILTIIFIVHKIQGIRFRNHIKELEHQNALEKERLRISRDLHDELGTGLSAILLNTSIAQAQLNKPDSVGDFLQRINGNTKDLYESMNNLVWLLKPENQTLDAMIIKLREVFSDICDDAGIDIIFELPGENFNVKLHREASRHIFLIIKEAVNNAIKYSGAKQLCLSVKLGKTTIQVSIEDNGCGFDANNQKKPGNGLPNMKNRIELLNGHLYITTHPGEGTKIIFELPINLVVDKD